MVAFLHPDSRRVQRAADPAGRGGRRVPGPRIPMRVTEAVQMDPGDSLELRHRLRAVGRRLVRRPRAAPRGARGAGRSRRSPTQTLRGEGDHARLRDVRRVLRRLHARVPAGRRSAASRCTRPVVFEVPSSPLPFWVLDFSPTCRLPAVGAAARHRQHRARQRSGARRRDRQAPRPRRARLDAHPRPPPPRWRPRRPDVLGAAGAVGAGLRPVPSCAPDAPREGGLAPSRAEALELLGASPRRWAHAVRPRLRAEPTKSASP